MQLMKKTVLTVVLVVKSAKYYTIKCRLDMIDIRHYVTLRSASFHIALHKCRGDARWEISKVHWDSGALCWISDNNVVLSTPNALEIPISNCQGQSYYNASNMAGKYLGDQQRIKSINPLVHFVPCSSHSLNIVSSCAAEWCVNAISSFGLIRALCNFFSASPHHWKLLTDSLHEHMALFPSLCQIQDGPPDVVQLGH